MPQIKELKKILMHMNSAVALIVALIAYVNDRQLLIQTVGPYLVSYFEGICTIIILLVIYDKYEGAIREMITEISSLKFHCEKTKRAFNNSNNRERNQYQVKKCLVNKRDLIPNPINAKNLTAINYEYTLKDSKGSYMKTLFFQEFVQASKEAAIDLGFLPREIVFTHYETRKLGVDYSAELSKDGLGFSFHLRTNTDKVDPTTGKLLLTLNIDYDKELDPYHFHRSFTNEQDRPHSLCRWVSWAIFRYRQDYQKVDLKSIFGNMELQILGFPGSDSEEEADILFNSISKLQENIVRIYRFRHIDEKSYLYRSISYAVLVVIKDSSRRFWIVFPDTAGLDSGGAYHTYLHFEELIKQLKRRLTVDLKRIDLPYKELEAFLLENANCFCKSIDKHQPELTFPACPKILENSEDQFNALAECFNKNEFAPALRDLRALIQQAEENVLKLKYPEFQIPEGATVKVLAGVLINKNILDGKLTPWVDAFVSVANQSSHKDFPTQKDLDDLSVYRRVMLTFKTGLTILSDLNDAIYPPVKIVPQELTFKVVKAKVKSKK